MLGNSKSIKRYGFKRHGMNVKVYDLARIIRPESIEIGDYSMIDDFTFIYGGAGLIIGRYVHISPFVAIIGGGKLNIGDYAVLASGSKIITGTDTYQGGKRMSTALPPEQRNILRGEVSIGKDAFIGINAVVHPNITIGEGAIIGSNSVVLRDVEPWSINVGIPSKKIASRPKVNLDDI